MYQKEQENVAKGTEKLYQTDGDLQKVNVDNSNTCCGEPNCNCTFASWVAYKVALEPKGKGFYEWLDGR